MTDGRVAKAGQILAGLSNTRKNTLLCGATVFLALLSIFITATALRLDIINWNSVCGARVRVYDPSYAAQLTASGFSGKMPLLVEAFLALAVPSILTRSLWAHGASFLLMVAEVALLSAAALIPSLQDHFEECYTGGHANSPGDLGFLIIAAVALVASLNMAVLAADWLKWLVQILPRVTRKQ